MAHPIPFKEANKILHRPSGMSAEECASIECYQDSTYTITRWQLTDDDIDLLGKNKGKIYLLIVGNMQPSKLSVSSPFVEENPES